MDLQLHGRTALVTGSSKGIGAGIAATLAREGAAVVVHGRDPVATAGVVGRIVADGGRAHGVLGDLTREDEVERLVADASRWAGRIDVLVNNAGGSGDRRDWQGTDPMAWSAAFERNVLAAVGLTRRLLPAMREAGWGRIINISSAAALMAPAGGPDYSAAKAAMNAMTASLAKAVAADGVTVNAVSPGTVRSDRLETAFRDAGRARGVVDDGAAWDEVERAVLPLFAQVPAGRVGEVADVANAVAFLAGAGAGYVTGVNLRVDGGLVPLI